MSDLGEISIEYMAGFFDGEGCINVSRRPVKKGHGSGHYFTIQVCVAQVREDIIKRFAERWGGYIYVCRKEYRRRPLYRWQASALVALNFLKEISPHLRLKTKQAELAIALLETPKGQRQEIGERVRKDVHLLNGSHGNFLQ